MSLNRFALRLVARKPAPKLIPRSGENALGVDCYVARLKNDGEGIDILFESYDKTGVKGLAISEDGSYSAPKTISWKQVDAAAIEITHFLSFYDFRYTSPLHFIVQQFTRWPHIHRLKDRAQQFAFNKTNLARTERIAALRILVDRTIERRDFSTSPVSMVQLLYSIRAFYHPDKDKLLAYCNLLLDSLVASGDVTVDRGSYKIHPKALVTLAMHDEESRRYQANLNQQVWIKWLTVILALAAIADILTRWFAPDSRAP